MSAPLPLPQDVVNWVHEIFRRCNLRVASRLSRMPGTYEPALDMSMIDELSQYSAPVRLGSGWTVRIDTHFLGGRRHFYSWEIADIGFLVLFRKRAELLRSKVALLQAKRLYPQGAELSEEKSDMYTVGFGRLLESEDTFLAATKQRRVRFADQSRYKALTVGSDQYSVIEKYEAQVGIPVYYLFYNPLRVPSSTIIPRRSHRAPRGPCVAGCRVVPSSDLRAALSTRADGYSPSYGDLRFLLAAPFDDDTHVAGWRLEHFVSELLIKCQEGHIAEDLSDEGLFQIFNRREGPISAAVSVTFDAPE